MTPAEAQPPRARGGGGRLRVALGLAIGVVALVIALWGVPLREVGQAFSGVKWWWLIGIAVVFTWQQLMRAWRQLLIIRAVRPESTYRTNLSVLCIGFLAINTVPGRMGEVVRPLLLLEREGVPLGVGFALVFLERVIDLCATFGMLAAVVFIFPPPSHLLTLGDTTIDWVAIARGAAATLLPAVLVAVVALSLFGQRLVGLVRPLFSRGPQAWQALGAAGLRFAQTFIEGLEAVRSPTRMLAIVAITFVTWAVSITMYPMAAEAFGFGALLGYGEGVGILAISMLGGIVPAPPGQAGTYEAFLRGGLALYDIAGPAPPPEGVAPSLDAAAVAFALTMHWWVMLVQALTALYFLAVDRIDLRELVRLARSGAWQDEGADPQG